VTPKRAGLSGLELTAHFEVPRECIGDFPPDAVAELLELWRELPQKIVLDPAGDPEHQRSGQVAACFESERHRLAMTVPAVIAIMCE
jgi:hypothetical protein